MRLKGIETLTRHAFDGTSLTTSRNALRCIANAMALKAETRQIFIDLGYEGKACKQLQNDSRDDEFLISRVLLLTTYGTSIDLKNLIDQHHLAESICTNISRHAKGVDAAQKNAVALDPMVDMALGESLKLLFNVTHFSPQESEAFSPALPAILTLLNERPISPTRPLEGTTGLLINSVINLPLKNTENAEALFPKATPNITVDRLIEILDKSTTIHTDDDLEELERLLSPLLTLITKVYEVATKDIQPHIRELLLPSIDDRQQPLGRGDSLSARLLRLSTNHITPKLQDSASLLLFELSGKDARTFVENIGYGFASGFLARNNLKLPEDALEAQDTASTGEPGNGEGGGGGWKAVNPITGQTLESEPAVEMPEMTDEEKEREAERLFVLFERYVLAAASAATTT